MKKSVADWPQEKQDEVEPAGTTSRETERQKELFELLDYAYIGARYDRRYKITKQRSEQLAPCAKNCTK